jgi:2-polyprenyl-3-methyl-5-hydroxy-6-metoxy-1,4-benzoquinol methylase
MGLLILQSENPRLSYAVHKRPDQVLCRKIRKGVATLWFANPETILVYFVDGPCEKSFQLGENGYVDLGVYASSQMYLSMITTFFKSAMAGSPDDAPGQNAVVFNSLRLSPAVATWCERLSSDVITVRKEGPAQQTGKVTMTAAGSGLTVGTLLQHVSVILFINGLFTGEVRHADEESVLRHAKTIAAVDLPFYFRYKFVERAVAGREDLLNRCREHLENPGRRYKRITLNLGGSQKQRGAFIRQVLSVYQPATVLDVGCGEGYHATHLVRRSDYIGFDPDENALERARHRLTEKGDLTHDWSLTTSEDEAISRASTASKKGRVVILCTEVIEHMSVESARELLARFLKETWWHAAIVTTPNATFNRHFPMTTPYRHDDHHWEMTMAEFQDLLMDALGQQERRHLSFQHVGDCVDGEGMSLGAALLRCHNDSPPT